MTKEKVMVGLVSDTHGWLDPALAEIFAGAHCIVHAGDVGDPEVLRQLEKIAPVVAVRGNIDGGELLDLPMEACVTVAGHSIASYHIAGSPKRPKRNAKRLLETMAPDIFVVGHSHIVVVGKVMGALWLNPGAAGRQGFHQERTAMRLWLSPGQDPELERVNLGPRSERTRQDQ